MTPPLFVAVDVPGEVAARLAAVGGGVPGARWVPAGNMHVTLRYLGEIDGATAADVRDGLAAIRAAPFALAIEGVGRFGSRGDTHALYAGVRPREPLERLRDKIGTGLRRLGLKVDGRAYRPHVTLARLRRAPADRVGRFLESNGLLSAPPFPVGAFALYESIRGRGGAVYREVERYPLTGGNGGPHAP